MIKQYGWTVLGFVLAFLFMIFALTRPAQAESGDIWGVITCCSKHSKEGDYNERNYGLGAEVEATERFRLSAGYFRNSNTIDSTYLLMAHCTVMWRFDTGRVCAGPAAGMVSGYALDLRPVVFPVVAYEWQRRLGANLSVFKDLSSDAWVLGLQVKATTRLWEPLK